MPTTRTLAEALQGLPPYDPAELVDWLGLVGATEIAERAGVTVSTVTKWQVRHDDFPAPIAELAQGRVWRWDDVEPWLRRHQAKAPGRPRKQG